MSVVQERVPFDALNSFPDPFSLPEFRAKIQNIDDKWRWKVINSEDGGDDDIPILPAVHLHEARSSPKYNHGFNETILPQYSINEL